MSEEKLYRCHCDKTSDNKGCDFAWETNHPEMMVNRQCPRCNNIQIRTEEIESKQSMTNFTRTGRR